VAAVPLLFYLVAPRMSIGTLAVLLVVGTVLTVVAWGAAVAYNVRRPGRGMAEIVSGTWLVPE
jgi:hypothetical protein